MTTNKKLKVFVPSFNRAAQLDLLLTSLQKNFADFDNLDIFVLFKYSNDDFMAGYLKIILEEKYKNITFEKETDFAEQFKGFLYNNIDEYVLLFVDDMIFFGQYYLPVDYIISLLTHEVYTFSFRLGFNTVEQYYLTGEIQPSLDNYGVKYVDSEHIKWNWKIGPMNKSYFYPFSWDGHVYRSEDIYEVVKDKTFENPRELESLMVTPQVRQNNPRKYIISPQSSKTFSNAVNCTQRTQIPAGVIHDQSAEWLNNMYCDGYNLNLDLIDTTNIVGTHTERKLIFSRGNDHEEL